MTELDVADLIVIAAEVLGIGTEAALVQIDIEAAGTALAEAATASAAARTVGTARDAAATTRDAAGTARDVAATAATGLMLALLNHPPFPRRGGEVAVASGLQYLSLNGWFADLDPPGAAAVVVEALGSGQLSPDDAATWLAPRLSPRRALSLVGAAAHRDGPRSRVLASAAVVVAASGLTLLATACAHSPATATGVSYAACMRSHGVRDFPDPSASGVIVVDASAGISRDSTTVQSAEQACESGTLPKVEWPRTRARTGK
jgi:hypothetical protein